jgi:hypothetical protein
MTKAELVVRMVKDAALTKRQPETVLYAIFGNVPQDPGSHAPGPCEAFVHQLPPIPHRRWQACRLGSGTRPRRCEPPATGAPRRMDGR